ncbi:multicopper oxidase family protein [Leptolyngbya cf. ectocarpi LEGE 11479]|uniref:Multicopper oxidase family protein n=1 Tax=Leptolyngbya cf. ectocarpi LEGE 11479 TaxID=1828722 RepID=A0A928ZW50_LEPEC|nr:multicopper oxidase family protein [Leptolyngbya ectocarpi]MBE9068563.1 multicopper oxidase family protein [Leptolyngbya cf. ectocarpi LEGE 11479]
MTFTRRDLIKVGLASSGLLLAPVGEQGQALAETTSNCDTKTVQPGTCKKGGKQWQEFESPLPIPEVLDPIAQPVTWREGTGKNQETVEVDYYEVHMRKGTQCIGGQQVEVWGYNGQMPGPTFYRPQDIESVVRFINDFEQDCDGQNINNVIHLHGMASLPQYDGYADDFIPPKYFKDYHYPNDRSATLWYHDHVAGRTQRNVGMGLAGMYIVYGPDEEELNQYLPSDYGDNDIPLILQTNPLYVNIDAPNKWSGQTAPPPPHYETAAISPPSLLVNGELSPVLDVTRRKYRFRVLNATDVNGMTLSLAADKDGKTLSGFNGFTVIGTDGGLTQGPIPNIPSLPISMGERYEIVVDFDEIYKLGNITEVYFYNEALLLNAKPGGAKNSWALMRFRIAPRPVNDPTSIPSDFLQGDRPFPCLDDKSLTKVTLAFQANGSVTQEVYNRTAGKTIYESTLNCKQQSMPAGSFNPTTGKVDPSKLKLNGNEGHAFVIGDRDNLGTTVGKSWMDGEPMAPFPAVGTAPTPSTQLPNVEDRIIPKPKLGEVQVWRLINNSTVFHPVHIHLLDTVMIERSTRKGPGYTWSKPQAPQKWERNWKDVYLLAPNEKIKIVGTFGPHPGRYMVHCHNLLHEDCDMMIEFEVMGENADSPLSDPAKPVSTMARYPLLKQTPAYEYGSEILRFNESVYGLSRSSESLHLSVEARDLLQGAESPLQVAESLLAVGNCSKTIQARWAELDA